MPALVRAERRLGSATAVVSLSTAAARGVGLVVSLLVAVVLGAEQLGVFALLTAASAFLGAAGVLGFAPLCTRAIADAQDPGAARVVTAFVLRTCTGFLIVLGAVYLAATMGPVRVPLPAIDSIWSCLLVPIWGLMIGVASVVQSVAAGHRSFLVLGVGGVARAACVGGGTLAGAAAFHSAVAAAWGAAAGEGLALVGCGAWAVHRRWVTRADLTGRSAPDVECGPARRRLLRQAALSGVASLGIQLSVWVGQVLVTHSPDGLVGAGVFLLASRLVLAVTLIPNALAAAALPLLAGSRSASERATVRRRSVMVALAAAVPVAALTAGLADMVLPHIDSHYLTYRSTVCVMGAVGVAMAANNVYGSLAVAEGRIRAWIASDWILAAALLAGAGLLVPWLGALGLAVAYVGAYALSAVVLARAVRQPTPVGDGG